MYKHFQNEKRAGVFFKVNALSMPSKEEQSKHTIALSALQYEMRHSYNRLEPLVIIKSRYGKIALRKDLKLPTYY